MVDPTPTSNNQEDHVSMVAHGARRLGVMIENFNRIIGIKLLCAAQSVEFRAALTSRKPLQSVLSTLRTHVQSLIKNRFLAPDLETAAQLVAHGSPLRATSQPFPELSA
ncbi:MAG: aromatic amino acid lyase, partial [Sedimentitalea sp.]